MVYDSITGDSRRRRTVRAENRSMVLGVRGAEELFTARGTGNFLGGRSGNYTNVCVYQATVHETG